jgi:hypothetical protein
VANSVPVTDDVSVTFTNSFRRSRPSRAGQQVCTQLGALPRPTITDLEPIVERDIALLLAGAYNYRAPRDNGPVVLAYGLATAAVRYFCPDKLSGLNE